MQPYLTSFGILALTCPLWQISEANRSAVFAASFIHSMTSDRKLFIPTKAHSQDGCLWQTTVYSINTLDSSVIDMMQAGGKTPIETLRNMQNRFAIGSFNTIVEPKDEFLNFNFEEKFGFSRDNFTFQCLRLRKMMTPSPPDLALPLCL